MHAYAHCVRQNAETYIWENPFVQHFKDTRLSANFNVCFPKIKHHFQKDNVSLRQFALPDFSKKSLNTLLMQKMCGYIEIYSVKTIREYFTKNIRKDKGFRYNGRPPHKGR